MSQFYEYVWPSYAAAITEIAPLQAQVANVPMNIFNNKYWEAPLNQLNIIKFGYIPKITISSAGNLSASSFLIKGMQNGVPITENLAGPNNATVSSVNNFDIVFSIVPSVTSATTASVGLSTFGWFPMINNSLNYYSGNQFFAMNFTVANLNAATYTVYYSLKDLSTTKATYLASILNGDLVKIDPANNQTSQLLQSNNVCANIVAAIATNNANTPTKFQYLKPGV